MVLLHIIARIILEMYVCFAFLLSHATYVI